MTKTKNGDDKIADSVGECDAEMQENAGSLIDECGELPRSYGGDAIFLVAQEPHWLFTYWDIDITKHPGGPTYLRVLPETGETEDEIEVPFETRNWYIPVKQAGSTYRVEIGYYRHEEWKVIARSAAARSHKEGMSESGEFEFATMPLHLSFQHLMDTMHNALEDGETLLQALARLQRGGKLFPSRGVELSGFSPDQNAVLHALLGTEVMENLCSAGLSSEEVVKRLREALDEKLSSPGGLSSLTSPGGENSLFGALEALSSGETLPSSWTGEVFSSWAVAALSSWMEGAKPGSSSQPSSSWSGEALASWSSGALSSWGPEQLTSWMQVAQTSWAEAALSSWNEQALSSFSHGAESSWSGASETLSSPGFGRNFFMHVNAEVIFYGGTDPAAKVTIDGESVALSPTGTFRYHFIFPDGTYEIPIVATSPDGRETRRAMLRFERDSDKSGGVEDTEQPPLSSPMGGKS